MLSFYDLTDESTKPVLNTFTGYEQNHESPAFSIKDAKNVTDNSINVPTNVYNFKHHENPNKPAVWLRRIKAHNVYYVQDSYKKD